MVKKSIKKSKRRAHRTPERENLFLKALKSGSSVAYAAQAAGVGRQTVYDWRHQDETFEALWDDAIEVGSDRLEDVALKRAVERSDRLLLAVLRARRPKVWGERSFTEHSGEINMDIKDAADSFERKLAAIVEP